MMSESKANLKGSVMLLVTALIWGVAFVAQSDGMNYVGAFTYNAVRLLIGAVVLIPVSAVLRFSEKKKLSLADTQTKPSSVKNSVIGGLCCGTALFAATSLQQIGLKTTTAGKAGFITALYIVIVPLFGLVLYRRSSLKMWLCTAAAIAGFWLLCINEALSVSEGDLYELGCAFIFAVHIMLVDSFGRKNTDGVMMSCVQFMTAGVISLIFALILEEISACAIFAAWLPILYSGVLSSGVAYTLQILAQKRTEPTLATLIMSLESVFAALAGWVLLGETLSFKELCGCLIVFAAVIFAQVNIPLRKISETK